MVYDVVIIGSGVVGAFAARELSRYKLDICIAEKASDVCMGTSKANSAIVHAGYDAEPGSLKAKLNVQGNELMEQVCCQLDIPFKRIGSVVLAFGENDRAKLIELMERGIKNGVKGLSIIEKEQLKNMLPAVSEQAAYALYAPSGGIVCPYELTIGAIENTVDNGVELKLDSEVLGIRFENGLFTINTAKEKIQCRYIVNAAGLFADRLAAMIGDESFSIRPRKGEYILFDKSQGSLIDKVVFQLPTNQGKGILVTPTVDGNLLIGPNAEDIDEKDDLSTSYTGLKQITEGAARSVPAFNMREVIASFAGLRARPSGHDFIVAASGANGNFINAAGIESPGLTAAPAIGKLIAEILQEQGLQLHERSDFNPLRRKVIRFREMPEKEMGEIIKKNPAYGRVVCRCEKVSEGEVVDCIRRSAGARNVDGVKRRTRAGMGRCQGGFCTPKVIEILARELGVSVEEITKMGGNSRLLAEKLKIGVM